MQTSLLDGQHTVAGVWRMAGAGFCASLVGIGLSRFAYTPLLPELIAAHWFTASAAAYLGAANLAGYLAGAIFAGPATAWISRVWLLRIMMLTATVSLFACAVPLSVIWFFLWRFLSGVAGGMIMVLAAPTIMPHVPVGRRGLVAGAVFVGVGCGIVASGTLVPALLRWGLAVTWQGLGGLALLLTILAWTSWPWDDTRQAPSGPLYRGVFTDKGLTALYVEYALNAAGLATHMVFFIDFVARGLQLGLHAGAYYWILFGLSAAVGPLVTGSIADRIGFRLALRLSLLAQTAAVGVLVVTAHPIALAISSIIAGGYVPGIVPLVFGRVHELTGGDRDRQSAAWRFSTIAFALGQAGAGYGLSYVFVRFGGTYPPLFAIGAGALFLAFVIDIATDAASPGRRTE